MIITVTLNAAIDKSLSVPNFRLGRRHRTVEQRTMAGGKGVNIARTLKTLIDAKRIPPAVRTLRFIWPSEMTGLNAPRPIDHTILPVAAPSAPVEWRLIFLVSVPVAMKLSRGTEAKAVEIEQVTRRVLSPTILASGSLTYQSEIKLVSEIIGRVKVINVKEGDQVSQGEVLLQLKDWASHLHDLGEHPVKHGVTLHFYNLCTTELGNPALPSRFQAERRVSAKRRRRGPPSSPAWSASG